MYLKHQAPNKLDCVEALGALKPWIMAGIIGMPALASAAQAPTANLNPEITRQLPAKSRALDVAAVNRGGKTYTFVRYITDRDNLHIQAFDPDFHAIAENAVPQEPRRWVSDRLRGLMDSDPSPDRASRWILACKPRLLTTACR